MMKWYVINTYSGLENKAKKSLEERIRQYNMEEKFGEILVPTEQVEEVKGGVKKIQSRKFFPGYMLVQMELSDETGHLVRNTQKVTGFVGGTKNPSSLSEREVERLRTMTAKPDKPVSKIEFEVGDEIRVADGPFANFKGTVEEVRPEKQKLKVSVSIFGRATAVELDYVQAEKVS